MTRFPRLEAKYYTVLRNWDDVRRYFSDPNFQRSIDEFLATGTLSDLVRLNSLTSPK
jgi:hypothetical protein